MEIILWMLGGIGIAGALGGILFGGAMDVETESQGEEGFFVASTVGRTQDYRYKDADAEWDSDIEEEFGNAGFTPSGVEGASFSVTDDMLEEMHQQQLINESTNPYNHPGIDITIDETYHHPGASAPEVDHTQHIELPDEHMTQTGLHGEVHDPPNPYEEPGVSVEIDENYHHIIESPDIAIDSGGLDPYDDFDLGPDDGFDDFGSGLDDGFDDGFDTGFDDSFGGGFDDF